MKNKDRSATTIIMLLTLGTLLAACSGQEEKPTSAGNPYDVLLMAENDTARAIVAGMLATPVEKLPQEEPMFDVKEVDNDMLTHATKYQRAIVIVETDTQRYSRTKVAYEDNVFASEQIMAYICTPSAAALKKDSARVAGGLLELLNKTELKAQMTAIATNSNKKAERMTDSLLCCHMSIPAELTSSKTGIDFLWLSDNGTETISNICIYSTPGKAGSPHDIIRRRDSVLAANIKGETPEIYMKTSRKVLPSFRRIRTDANSPLITEIRGLWEMEGDAMGGPFVSLTLDDKEAGRTITAEAFLYAPGKDKRDKLRRLEAALYTLQTKKNN